MACSANSPGDYRIEISGWGLDNNFFVEQTDLQWTTNGTKNVRLRRALREGAMVFVRLLSSECSNSSVPVPYRIECVEPMDCGGRCQVTLKQLHGRAKESSAGKRASNRMGESRKRTADKESEDAFQREEVLQ